MKRIKALIVDDSPVIRMMLNEILSSSGEIEIIGEVGDGRRALDKVKSGRPDIVLMDIEMPVMDGLTAIEHIMSENPVPILVITGREDAQTAYNAISRGALEVITKPEVDTDAENFVRQVKILAGVKVIRHMKIRATAIKESFFSPKEERSPSNSDRIIAVASSTGGPKALSLLLSGLPAALPCPIVIAQHITDGFLPGMVKWLTGLTALKVKTAVRGEQLIPGVVYFSPTNYHMEINTDKRVSLVKIESADIYRPSCDKLLLSVAKVYKSAALGIILTGMGYDGAKGIKKIKSSGGVTIAQDEETSVVFGMNAEAIKLKCIDQVLPVQSIASTAASILCL